MNTLESWELDEHLDAGLKIWLWTTGAGEVTAAKWGDAYSSVEVL